MKQEKVEVECDVCHKEAVLDRHDVQDFRNSIILEECKFGQCHSKTYNDVCNDCFDKIDKFIRSLEK